MEYDPTEETAHQPVAFPSPAPDSLEWDVKTPRGKTAHPKDGHRPAAHQDNEGLHQRKQKFNRRPTPAHQPLAAQSADLYPFHRNTGAGHNLGLKALTCPHPDHFNADGLTLLTNLGAQIAIGVEKARLFQAVREREEAKEVYASAVREGKKAALVEQLRPNLGDTGEHLTHIVVAARLSTAPAGGSFHANVCGEAARRIRRRGRIARRAGRSA